MEVLLRDLRFGVRTLAKNPAFTLAAMVTLALGIGANTGIFTVTNAVLLRPFPYSNPERLVSLDAKDESKDFGGTLLRYELVRDRNKAFESVAVWANDDLNLTGVGEPLQVAVVRVSPNFFSMLGVQPQLGRSFSIEEGKPEGPPVVMLSNSIWRRRFGSRDVVGQTVNLDNAAYTIIGVLPANVEFPFAGPADIWTPRYFEFTLMTPQQLRAGVGYLGMLARLRPKISLAAADADLVALNQQYREQNPTAPDAAPSVVMTATPLRDLVVSNIRGRVLMLSGAVGVVLLIACANVASLLLSLAIGRRKEIAVRTALGASRRTILRQLLTESTLLSLAAGMLGVGVSWLATRALVAWGASQIPQGIPVAIDTSVLLFTLLVSLIAGILFGTAPALQLSRIDANSALRDEGRTMSAGHSRMRMNSALVVGQVALSFVLLIAAGLLLRSFGKLLQVDPGIDAHNVLAMNISLPTAKYAKPQQQIEFFDELLRKVSALPSVRDAAISAALPLSAKRITPMLPEGQTDVPLAQRPFLDIEAVSPGWLDTMRVPLRGGREFTEADQSTSPKVVIVNETFARRFWPNQNPVGKHVHIGRWPQPAEVVGVAADVKNKGLAQDPQAQVYIPFAQLAWANMNLLVRTAVPPQNLIAPVRAQIAAIDPDQPVTGIQTVDEILESSRTQPRFTMLLLSTFSAIALALAVIGIYGVLAYSVAQRRHELGIRLALGAERDDILLMVVRQGLIVAVAGVGIGLAAALVLTRWMSTMLYEISSYDLITFGLTPLVMIAIALLASYIPARVATRVDPMEAMRGS